MNILLNEPSNYQDWNIINEKYHKRIENNKEQLEKFYELYYVNTNKFSETDITIYDNLIPKIIMDKVSTFSANSLWKYNYEISTNNKQKYVYDNIVYEEIKKFSVELCDNIYFHNLFHKIILPEIDIENKQNIMIDRLFMSGRLHGLSDFYHKDDRSSIKYGPSVYVFVNENWKSYYDGSFSCILDDSNSTNTKHVEIKQGRIVVFPPNINHKFCEISGYGLLENAFNKVLEYHLIYI